MEDNKGFSKYYPLIYLVISFGFSWLLFLPNVFADNALATTPLLIARIIAGYGPAAAAVILVWLSEGREAVQRLLRSVIDVAGRAKWIAAAVVIAVLSVALPIVVLIFTQGFSLERIPTSSWLRLLPNFIISLLFHSSVADEIGWRGFFLPKLQQQNSAFASSVIAGLLWGLWQLPTYYFVGLVESHLSLVWLLIETAALSVILTWIYNSTKSLAVPVIFNGVFRTLTQFFMPLAVLTNDALRFQQLYSGVLVNIAIAILLFCGGKTLVFSYQPRRSGNR